MATLKLKCCLILHVLFPTTRVHHVWCRIHHVWCRFDYVWFEIVLPASISRLHLLPGLQLDPNCKAGSKLADVPTGTFFKRGFKRLSVGGHDMSFTRKLLGMSWRSCGTLLDTWAHQCTVAQIVMPSAVNPLTTFITCRPTALCQQLEHVPSNQKADAGQQTIYVVYIANGPARYAFVVMYSALASACARTSRALKESKPVVGSSKNSTRGRVTSATPTVVRLHCGPTGITSLAKANPLSDSGCFSQGVLHMIWTALPWQLVSLHMYNHSLPGGYSNIFRMTVMYPHVYPFF